MGKRGVFTTVIKQYIYTHSSPTFPKGVLGVGELLLSFVL